MHLMHFSGHVGSIIFANLYESIKILAFLFLSIKLFGDQCESISINSDQ